MSWEEVKRVNSDNHSSLNHMIWINDYKTYTTNSYVYNNSAILDELLSDYWICINDMAMRVASFEKAIEKNQVGKAITAQSNIEGNYPNIKTLADLYATTETELIDGMLDSTGKLQWLTSNSLITIPPSVTDAGLSQGKTSLSTTLVNAWAADSDIVAKYTADVDTWYNMTQSYPSYAVNVINTQANIKKVVDNSTTKTVSSNVLVASGTSISKAGPSANTQSYTSSAISLTDIRYVIACGTKFDYYLSKSTDYSNIDTTCKVSLSVFSKYSVSAALATMTNSTMNLSSTYSIIPVGDITTFTGSITLTIFGYRYSNGNDATSNFKLNSNVYISVTGIV